MQYNSEIIVNFLRDYTAGVMYNAGYTNSWYSFLNSFFFTNTPLYPLLYHNKWHNEHESIQSHIKCDSIKSNHHNISLTWIDMQKLCIHPHETTIRKMLSKVTIFYHICYTPQYFHGTEINVQQSCKNWKTH